MVSIYECPAGYQKEIELDIPSMALKTFDEIDDSFNFCEHCKDCTEDVNVQFIAYNKFGTTKKVKSCWLVRK